MTRPARTGERFIAARRTTASEVPAASRPVGVLRDPPAWVPHPKSSGRRWDLNRHGRHPAARPRPGGPSRRLPPAASQPADRCKTPLPTPPAVSNGDPLWHPPLADILDLDWTPSLVVRACEPAALDGDRLHALLDRLPTAIRRSTSVSQSSRRRRRNSSARRPPPDHASTVPPQRWGYSRAVRGS